MLDICYYSSDYYAPYTGISMYSLLNNNYNLDIRLHCIDFNISKENKIKMSNLAKHYKKELFFHEANKIESIIRDEMQLPDCNGSYATYIKFFPELFFSKSDKLLFIDGDTIIDGSIQELVDMDMSEYIFSAVRVSLINESWIYKENDPNNLRYIYSLKFHDTGYYNIGIFLVNPQKWKELNFGQRIIDEMSEHLELISKVDDIPIDEMLLNLAAQKSDIISRVYSLSTVYNCIAHNIPFSRAVKVNQLCGYIDMDDFKKGYFNPIIIHFCIFKPWFTDTFSRFYYLVDKYRRESPWPDAFTMKKYKSISQKIYSRFFYPMENESIIYIGKKIWKVIQAWKNK
ncbi:MAG: hypothetical protein K6D97_06360 [Clostridia bacterium]|nr:hypothetical protein [Clostridia bacterium]